MDKLHHKNYPRLREVNPVIADDVLIFGFLNIVIGAGLYSEVARTLEFFIINDVFTNQFWGAMFFGSGVALLLSYFLNRWRFIRGLLLFCLFLKSIWIVALSTRQFEALNTNIFLVVFFTALGIKQLSSYLRFPKIAGWKK